MAKIEVAGRQLQNSDFAGFIAGHLFIHYLDGDGERFVIDAFTNGEPNNELYVASSGGNYLAPFESYEQQFESITDFVEIDVGDRSVENVIFVMEQLARAIDEEKLPYDDLNQNSNSTAALLLDLVGVEIDDVKPNPPGALLGFPGHDDEISLNYQIQGTDDDDVLVGRGGSQTFLGSSGNDSLSGGADADRLTGGEGKDLFLGTPEHLNGDIINDLEIGDRIGVSGATVDEETLEDEEGGDTTITFNADRGIFDIGGTDVSINATLPLGALLRLSDDTLEDGGSIIEVVEGTTLTPDQDFYTGTTSNGLLFASWTRDGDLSFEIDVLNTCVLICLGGRGPRKYCKTQ
jgi:Ca2+-binding RTX toxin-like protein